ncbi:ABC transporter ATP-binding protein [Roseibium sp. M-1]
MSNNKVELVNVSKTYGNLTALQSTNLTVKNGEFVTLLGPSGSGKTTILNLISGMITPNSGQVIIDGMDLTHTSPGKRGLGMVFQHYALMPHMNVFENVAYPLRVRKVAAAEIKRRVSEVLETVRLPNLALRKPSELSGGQQQRIAIARCLVYKPSIILMDEPLGALDKKLREEMQLEIKRLHEELNITALYVTHDQEEALTMSDRIVLMNKGAIEQLGTPREMYFEPKTVFAATFLGDSNVAQGKLTATASGCTVQCDTGAIHSSRPTPQIGQDQQAIVMIRPESLSLSSTTAVAEAGWNVLSGHLVDSISFGGVLKHYVQLADGSTFTCQELSDSARLVPGKGEQVTLRWRYQDTIVLKPDLDQAPAPFVLAAE